MESSEPLRSFDPVPGKDGIHCSIHGFRADQFYLSFLDVADSARDLTFPSILYPRIIVMGNVAMKVVVNRNQKQLSFIGRERSGFSTDAF